MTRALPVTFIFSFCSFFLIGQSTIVNTFQNTDHLGGAGTVIETFDFPDDVAGFDQVLMHIDLNCPAGMNCDPFDRVARILARKDGQEYEIGRYVTPFGIGTCGWTIDVSAYRTILTGEVELFSSIETWANGWSLTLDFEFIEGTPEFEYVKIHNLWHGWDSDLQRSYGNFQIGDTLWISDNLPERVFDLSGDAEKVMVRAWVTGHGQGNTDNAAEFHNVTHSLKVNGQSFDHQLWKSDCNSNPCSPQNGTWEFARAGWCPGQDVKPKDFDLTGVVSPGTQIEIDYILEPYLNKCSPLYPDCNPASDCAFGNQVTCNFDGNLHTEPRYIMAIQLIVMSNAPIQTKEITRLSTLNVGPSPTTGMIQVDLRLPGTSSVNYEIFDIQGKRIFAQTSKQAAQQHFERFELGSQDAGMYIIKATTKFGILQERIFLVR